MPPARTYTLSLHDALPISEGFGDALHAQHVRAQEDLALRRVDVGDHIVRGAEHPHLGVGRYRRLREPDRKSTRLNSSHVRISYAVFCLKKKNPSNRRATPG